MRIVKAQPQQFDSVKQITHKTISKIYPHYYTKNVVKFFLDHHNDEAIMSDILNEMVYFMMDKDEAIGTITIKGNEINRLFVLPAHQHKGIGKQLMDFAESVIAEKYNEIYLASSLPAKKIYTKRGYVSIEVNEIVVEDNDVLCYDLMKKNSNHKNKHFNYDSKIFVPKSNTENGEVNQSTVFHYHQKEDVVWAQYSGGEIKQGFLVGTVNVDGELNFTYQHLNEFNELRLGKCHSVPTITPDGKIELYENWQWLNGDKSKGSSIITEL